MQRSLLRGCIMSSILRGFLVLTLTMSSAAADSEERVPVPYFMAVLGDSISEGMLSEFSVEQPPTLGQMFSMVNLAKKFSGIERLTVFRDLYAKPQHSWATGDDDTDIVQSHLERLRSIRPSLNGVNLAVAGSRTQDLLGQVDHLLTLESQSDRLTDYLMVFLGSNDLWGEKLDEMIPPNKFEDNVYTALKRLLDQNPHRLLLLVGLPHIDKIFKSSESMVAYKAFGSKISCKEMRENIYGKAIIFDSSNAEYDNARVFIEMYRNALRQSAKRLQDEFPAAHIRAIQDYDMPSLAYKSLSTDCFHPSLWGQALLAEMTWRAGFWPDLVTDEEKLAR